MRSRLIVVPECSCNNCRIPVLILQIGELLGKLYSSHLAELTSEQEERSAVECWCLTWIEPVLQCLNTASEVHGAMISEVAGLYVFQISALFQHYMY